MARLVCLMEYKWYEFRKIHKEIKRVLDIENEKKSQITSQELNEREQVRLNEDRQCKLKFKESEIEQDVIEEEEE